MPQRILHLIPFLWSGAGAVVTELCEHQARSADITIVTSGRVRRQRDWPSYRRRLAQAGVRHATIDLFSRESDIVWGSIDRLCGVVREFDPDVMHAHAGVPTAAALAARSLTGSRARVMAHMYSWGPGRPRWMDVMDLRAYADADRILCSARAYERTLVEGGVPARKLVYVPWGLPLDRLDAAAKTPGSHVPPTVGFVGRIEPRKGQLDLVRGFAHAHGRHPEARLELVGPVADEEYAGEIRRTVAKYKLETSVRLTGRFRDVYPRMARWSLFVSLSRDEGQGLAVLEAMALGVPVVALRVAGIEDFLDDFKTGRVVSSPSPRVVGSAIAEALANPASLTALAARARTMVHRRYGWNATLRTLERVYRT